MWQNRHKKGGKDKEGRIIWPAVYPGGSLVSKSDNKMSRYVQNLLNLLLFRYQLNNDNDMNEPQYIGF